MIFNIWHLITLAKKGQEYNLKEKMGEIMHFDPLLWKITN